MEFEWSDKKRTENISKHGVDFEYAALIFAGPVFSVKDEREDYGEARYKSIGMVDDTVIVVVVHTDREGRTRIISAWKGGRKDHERYTQNILRGTSGEKGSR